jgi:hypothetical protein
VKLAPIFRGGLRWPSVPKPGWRVVVAVALAIGIAAIALLLRVSDQAGTGARLDPAVTDRSDRSDRVEQKPAVAGLEAEQNKPTQNATAEPQAQAIVDIFAPRTWQPPPPPPVEAAAQPPQAPPLPFRLIGRFVEPGKAPLFLLAEGERVIAVRVGDRIGDSYRVEKIEKGQLEFRYRPMNMLQALAVGELP